MDTVQLNVIPVAEICFLQRLWPISSPPHPSLFKTQILGCSGKPQTSISVPCLRWVLRWPSNTSAQKILWLPLLSILQFQAMCTFFFSRCYIKFPLNTAHIHIYINTFYYKYIVLSMSPTPTLLCVFLVIKKFLLPSFLISAVYNP